MSDESQWLKLLKGVSRSFYLSLRLLPAPMRRGAVLAYLLARASDTVADTASVSHESRSDLLLAMKGAIDAGYPLDLDFGKFRGSDAQPAEVELLGHLAAVWECCQGLPTAELSLIQEVIGIIISGQHFDLVKFHTPGRPGIVSLSHAAELEDYTYRVAGCVGEFWTRLGLLTLGDRFSRHDPAGLARWGREYGMGLQLVNILRDLPEDVRAGRCYLPVPDPTNREQLMAAHRHWLVRARELVSSGLLYADAMGMARLGIASGLPAEIAVETIGKLEAADWDGLTSRVKIPRSRVYALMAKQARRQLFG